METALIDLIRQLRGNTFMRFLVAGAANTLFGFVVYSLTILAGAAVWLALLAGIFAGPDSCWPTS